MASAQSASSNKRKRGAIDQDGGRNAKMQNTNGDNSANAYLAQTLQGLDESGLVDGGDSTLTAQAALAAPIQHSAYPEPESFEDSHGLPPSFDDGSGETGELGSTAQALFDARQATMNAGKPAVGTAQWHQQRKDNHKAVERRRREVINEGIENLAKRVPNCDKNKGSILQNTCQFIDTLLEQQAKNETAKAVADQSVNELVNRIEKMKQSAEQAWAESAKWQRRCREASLQFDDYDDGSLPSFDD